MTADAWDDMADECMCDHLHLDGPCTECECTAEPCDPESQTGSHLYRF